MTHSPEPPRNFEALKSMLIANRDELPPRLVQVAAFALENPDEVALGTAASIAAQASVQPSTLIRFAKRLGYAGFSDLQDVFRSELRAMAAAPIPCFRASPKAPWCRWSAC
jgi:DNA-binding MurR/RpiR family transcriptional regulator